MAHLSGMREFETLLPILAEAAGLDWSDDVAQLRGGSGRIVTVDALVEGVHFLATDPIDTVARKLVRVNVSDILAKGARPAEALLTLGWPEARGEGELRAFAGALAGELRAWDAALVGGDTVRSPGGLFLSLTLTGDCLGPGPVRRDGGQAGDGLWVTGTIGAGGLGLAAALAGDTGSPFLARYWEPRLPPLAVAGLIGGHARAAMDISDGLLGACAKLAAASGCGAGIDLSAVPWAGPADSLAARLDLATAGDDYQCLFALDPARVADARAAAEAAGVRITRVGKLAETPGLTLVEGGKPVPLPSVLSFQHGAGKARGNAVGTDDRPEGGRT